MTIQPVEDAAPEVELVVALRSGGADIPETRALDCVYGYAVGLDMTRRDLQGAALNAKLPWEPGKSFDHSAPCTAITPAAKSGHPSKGRIWLNVNGKLTQEGDLADMILSVPKCIAFLSTYCELKPGDLTLVPQLHEALDRASRVVIRMRQKVVVPPLPTTPPRWVVDPDFDLDYHLRRVALPAPGTLRQLLDLAELTLQSPLDTSRALWEAVYVEGLEGNRSALLTKLSHAITDGLGGIALLRALVLA